MIRFLIFGYGHIGKRHVSIIAAHQEARLEGVIEIDSHKRAELPSGKAFASIEEWKSGGNQVDIAIIALPNGLHCSTAVQCIREGMHVIIEKPMGLTTAECAEVIETAEGFGKKVFVVKQNRYSPPSLWMKGLIASGKLGEIYEVHTRCFWNRDERYYQKSKKSELNWRGSRQWDGGVLFTQFSHFVDVLYWVFGDIRNISARMYNHNHRQLTEFPDSGSVHFDFENGGIGTLQFSTSVFDQNMESSMTVIGQYGSFRIGGQYMDKVDYCHIRDYDMPDLGVSEPPNDYGAFQGSAANHVHVIENAVEAVQGKTKIATGGADGMKIVDMIVRIHQAAGHN